MRNVMLRMVASLLIIVHIICCQAAAEDCSKAQNKEFLYSEDLGDKPGLYTLKILKGPEVQAVFIAQQDLIKRKALPQADIVKYKHYIYIFKDFYEVEIRKKKPETLILDGWEIHTYRIDAKDFSIISRSKSVGTK